MTNKPGSLLWRVSIIWPYVPHLVRLFFTDPVASAAAAYVIVKVAFDKERESQ